MIQQQAQMGALQPQLQFPQQQIDDVVSRSGLIISSTSSGFSSVNIVSAASQSSPPTYVHAPQPTTVHIPVTTVQYNSQQKLLCDISTDETSPSSQVYIQ